VWWGKGVGGGAAVAWGAVDLKGGSSSIADCNMHWLLVDFIEWGVPSKLRSQQVL